jgi:hypothetical protein
MLRKSIGIYFLLLVLTLFLVPANSHAIPFTGDAVVANHVDTGVAQAEWYLVFDRGDVPGFNPTKVKLKGFKFLTTAPNVVFDDLGFDDPLGIQLDNNKKKLKKWQKKAAKKGEDFVAYVNDMLAAKSWKFKTKQDGAKYTGLAAWDEFDNPLGGGGVASASVPEPAVLILLGGGLLGLGTLRRFRKS